MSVIVAAAVLALATFLSWADLDGAVEGSVTGWERDDGIITLVVGVVAAGLGGLVLAGVRHLFVKLGLLLCGLTTLAVFFIDALDVARDDDRYATVDITPGVGLWLVGLSGLALVVLAVVDRSPWGLGSER